MSKLLKILGGVFLALVITGIGAAMYFIPKANRLNEDAVGYIEKNVPAIVSGWNPEELIKRGAPEMLTPTAKTDLPKLFTWLSTLGKLKKLDKATGNIFANANTNSAVNGTFGKFTSKAEFDAGTAVVTVSLKRVGESWQITGFYVNSPALIPLKT